MPGPRSLRALSLGVALLGCCVNIGPLCAQTNATLEKESDTIRGTVVNSVTREPVGRALVHSSDNRFAALTDSNGHFEFKVPPSEAERRREDRIPSAGPVATSGIEGTLRPTLLMARKPGFLSDDYNRAAQLSPGQKEVTIYLVPGALIVGHVTVASADSPEKIQVEIYRRQIEDGRAHWSSAGTFTTWSNGDFRFSELPPGTYKLFTHELMDRDPLTFNPQGQLYGYPPVYFPGMNNFAAGSTIRLTAGITFTEELSPSRREYYPVEIAVANASEGVQVQVEVSAGGQEGPGYSLGYNPRTQKVQGFLPDGTYTIEVSSFGPGAGTGTTDIAVKGAAASEYAITLVPNVSIGVNVTEEFTSTEGSGDGEQSGLIFGTYARRPNGLGVGLEPADELDQQFGASLRQTGGPEDKSPEVENVRPGRYWVLVESARGYVASIKYGETDLLHQPLVVPAGGSLEPIEVTLRDDGAQVEGVVENVPISPGSSPTSAAQTTPLIYLIPTPDSTGQFRAVWSSPDGTFSSKQVPPGDYRVLAFDREQPELEYRNEEAMRKYHSQDQEIRLAPGQNLRLRLHMISGNE